MTTIEHAADSPPGGYAAWARRYLDAGWRGVLPLPEGRKMNPPSGYTGHDGADPDSNQLTAWAQSPRHQNGNLCLRLPSNVIAFDVDNHDGKPAAETIAAMERAAGVKLPDTWTSTSRADGSFHAFYRVPELAGDIAWPSNLKPFGEGVEVLHRGHRYSVVYPSTNPANGGRQYRWRRPDGTLAEVGEIPSPDGLTELPQAIIDTITAPRTRNAEKATEAEGGALLNRLAARADYREPMSPRITKAVETALEEFPGNGHETIAASGNVQGKVIRYAEQGDAGLGIAHATLRAGFIASVGPRYADRDPRGDGEAAAARDFDRAWEGAGRTVAGDPTPDYVRKAFKPGGFWHQETPDESESSWSAVDIGTLLDQPPPEPTHMPRADGVALMYAGKVHSVHGESESGKSWFVQAEAARVLKGGGAVLYLDFESEGRDVARRLLSMGVPREVVTDPQRFVYAQPDIAPDSGGQHDKAQYDALLAREFSFAVVDGVTDSMSVFGLNSDKKEEVGGWMRRLPRAIARKTGAAVVIVDHVNKDPETRGRFATGSQHKMSGLDGSAFTVEQREPFGIGLHGVARIQIVKDRGGAVRPFGGPRDKDAKQDIGEFHLDSTEAGVVVATLEPQEAMALNDPARVERARVDAQLRKTVPTDLRDPKVTSIMEDTWKVVSGNAGVGYNDLRKKVKARRGEKPGGPKANPTSTDDFATAVELLAMDGHIVVGQEGQKKPHHAIAEKPYTELRDTRSRKHHEARVSRPDGPLVLKVTHSDGSAPDDDAAPDSVADDSEQP